MTVRQSEFRAQGQDPDSERDHASPQLAGLGQQPQPDRLEQYKKKDCGEQIDWLKAKVSERAVHGNDATTKSTATDGIG